MKIENNLAILPSYDMLGLGMMTDVAVLNWGSQYLYLI